MSSNHDRISQRNARTSSVSTVIGISLVLFMLGTLGLILLKAKKISEHVKENIQLQVFFKENVSDSMALATKTMLDSRVFTRKTEFISKEQAAQDLKADLGEDFVSELGFNPLYLSVSLYLKADHSDKSSIDKIVNELRQREEVIDVSYHPNLIDDINANINRIAIVMLGFSALLLLISIALINNTIRLAIYSKRFLIKTMQLVGATPGFIRRPFLWQGTLQGLYASFIAMALIGGLVYFIRSEMPEFFELQDFVLFSQLFGAVVLIGITIAWISTWMAVRKYIRLKSEDVY